MTIKEAEALCGMKRANIRFYEAEGLVSPSRGANGYRDYSQEDVTVLMRLKLLRSLHIPLEEIRALQEGRDTLSGTLARHITALEMQRQTLDRADQVCREIQTDGVSYETLDAGKYLDALEAPAEVSALSGDVIPAVRAPWRRFFARMLDMWLYTTLWSMFLLLVCHVNVTRNAAGTGLVSTLAALGMMLFGEPLLLRLWGTTPGKWIMGLYVRDEEGQRLRYQTALDRTMGALWYGMGAWIPVYRLVRLWKSGRACEDGQALPWEADGVLSLREKPWWLSAALGIGYGAALAGMVVLSMAAAEAPRHWGALSAAEFCDNFNRLAAYEDVDFGGTGDSQGRWQEAANPHVIRMGVQTDPPDFTFQETDGFVTAVGFRFHTNSPAVYPASYQEQMLIAALSYAGAQGSLLDYIRVRDGLVGTIQAHPYESFSLTANGVTVRCQVAYSGYDRPGADFLLPVKGAETAYDLSFEMTGE